MKEIAKRAWLYGMTADEWFHLACEGDESEVQPCCGNIGSIRDQLRFFMTFQSPDDIGWRLTCGKDILTLVEGDGSEHGLDDAKQFPLLHRVLEGIRNEMVLGVLACAACTEGDHRSCDDRRTKDGRRYCTCKESSHT